MIDLDLTDEHRLLQQTVQEWAGRAVAPRIKQLDREHRFDRGILPQMAELGLLGICVPGEHGGAGMDYLSLGVDHDTPVFAVTSIEAWWNQVGRQRYPTARELFITADAGGSNSYGRTSGSISFNALLTSSASPFT